MITARTYRLLVTRTVSLAAAALLLTLLSACSAITVTQDYDTDYDFSRLKTYAWFPGTREKSALDDQELAQVRSALESNLKARGYREVSSDPDFLVTAHATTEQKSQFVTRSYGYGYWEGYDTYRYNVGTLVVDFVDPDTNRLIWRGQAEAVLGESPTSEERDKRLNEAVAKMLHEFPAGKDNAGGGYR